MPQPTITPTALQQRVGTVLGESDWRAVSQDAINLFAESTDDHQYSHVDAEKAAATPFGGTIAHGLLTLSLLPALAEGVMPRLAGQTMGVNYGFNKVRFVNPVPSNSRIKASFLLADIQQRSDDSYLIRYEVTVLIEGQEKPALVADWLSLAVL